MFRILPLLFLLVHKGAESAKVSHKGDTHKSTFDRTLESVMPRTYDPLERPSQVKEPTAVYVSVHLSHIEWSFDRLTVVMYLRQKWIDHRLKRLKPQRAAPVICKPIDLQQHLWFPDTFLANMIDETKVLNAGFVQVDAKGEITYSILVKSSVACPPYAPSRRLVARNGEIDCEIDLESFAYSSEEVDLKWMSDNTAATIDDAYNEMIKAIGTGEMTIKLPRGTYSRLTLNLTLDTGLGGQQLDFAMRRFYGR